MTQRSELPMLDVKAENELIQLVLNSAFQVHRELGPGLLESVYEGALFFELGSHGLFVQRQLEVPLSYKGRDLGLAFRADLLVERALLLELKAVDEINEHHLSQTLTYLKLLNLRRGYILNFSKKWLKEGIKRVSR